HLLLEALHRLMEGRTTLIIAHRLSTIVRADQVAVLKGGKLVERGTHAELLARGGFYASIFNRQLKKQRPRLHRVPASARRTRRALVRVVAERHGGADRLVASWSGNGHGR
ncbi:MAG: hypothetical protein M3328_12140, partial [Chloroflexota bacterium]|nr:hypothetical protein [Chloroflexota bacterium]